MLRSGQAQHDRRSRTRSNDKGVVCRGFRADTFWADGTLGTVHHGVVNAILDEGGAVRHIP